MHWLVLLFLVKLVAGAAYGYLFTKLPNYAQNADTWRLFFAGVSEKQWLLQNPGAWLADIYTPRYSDDAGMLATQNSLLNDLKDVLVVKCIAIFNLLSGSRYYVNLIFFNYLFLFGQVALAIVWSKVFKLQHAGIMLIAVCLWPSVLFWSSGFHRDGMLLHFLGWASWLCWNIWQAKRVTLLQVLTLAICLLFILLFRNYVAVFFIGAASVAFVVHRFSMHAKKIVVVGLVLALVALLALSKLDAQFSLPTLLAERQSSFLALEGQSKMEPLPLNDSWVSLAGLLPQAVLRATMVPPIAAPFRISDLPFSLENVLWMLSILPAIFYTKNKMTSPEVNAWISFTMLLVAFTLIITGYTIPFATAIIRYKSLMWPFITPWVVYWWYCKGQQWMPAVKSKK